MKNWLQQAKELGASVVSRGTEIVNSSAGYVQSTVGNAWIFGSLESTSLFDQKRDERHYFLVPDHRTSSGYSIYVMRCLPAEVPPINDLPKFRIFHLPNEHALPTVQHILVSDAKEAVETEAPGVISSRLNEMADQIDKLDSKVFHGVLVVGGLVALVNPAVGAMVAAKALVPSAAMLLSKFGLKYAGDGAKSVEVSQRIKAAEKEVMQQFRGSKTESVVNPLLRQLDIALDTTEEQYDPVMEFSSEEMDFGERDRTRMLQLTCQAIANTYEAIIANPAQAKMADVGPEDLRFLKLVQQIAEEEE